MSKILTNEMVEAAAEALHETSNPWFDAHGDWGAAGFDVQQAFRESAHAALRAALAVAFEPERDVLQGAKAQARLDEDGSFEVINDYSAIAERFQVERTACEAPGYRDGWRCEKLKGHDGNHGVLTEDGSDWYDWPQESGA